MKLLPSIVSPLKAVKTRVEIDGFRKAHVQDGVALVFTVWLSRR